MGSLSFGEILTILVVILIIFGPRRLPEAARKVGEAIAWGRRALQQFTDEVQSEFGDEVQPFTDVKTEFDGAKQDIKDVVTTMTSSPEIDEPTSVDDLGVDEPEASPEEDPPS